MIDYNGSKLPANGQIKGPKMRGQRPITESREERPDTDACGPSWWNLDSIAVSLFTNRETAMLSSGTSKLYLKLCQTADVSDASKIILLDGGNVWS